MKLRAVIGTVSLLISSYSLADISGDLTSKYQLVTVTDAKSGAEKNNIIGREPHTLTARGVLKASLQATLAAGIGAQISQLDYREGMAFSKGDTLVKFDCRKPMADIQTIKVGVKIHEQKVAMNEEMAKFNSISNYELLLSKTELAQAKAELKAKQIDLDACQIKSPYDGRVVETLANRYEVVAKNDPLINIVNTNILEAQIIIPSQWLSWLQQEAVIAFHVDEIDHTLMANVTHISPVVDPVSKTVSVIARFNSNDIGKLNILPGMSGTALFSKEGSNI